MTIAASRYHSFFKQACLIITSGSNTKTYRARMFCDNCHIGNCCPGHRTDTIRGICQNCSNTFINSANFSRSIFHCKDKISSLLGNS